MTVRKAEKKDLSAVAEIYADIHTEEERGTAVIGWSRDIYPTEQTALQALQRDDLFVAETDGRIIGTAIINRRQVDVYAAADWKTSAPDDEVMVLYTLVISPKEAGRGYGRDFVAFYEQYARSCGCSCLRLDTNERNQRARAMYRALGYQENCTVPCVFNGLEGVRLVLLEKRL